MKSLKLIVCIIVLSISNIEAGPHNNTKKNPEKQHTFLVKTDLTKEQVEFLLNQYHQNKNQHQNQGEITNLKHQSPEVPEAPETPEEPEMTEVVNENETETISLKKKGNKKKEKNGKPEASESSKTQVNTDVPEVPEVEKKNETEEIGSKKGGIEKEKEKEKVKRIGIQQNPDSSETTGGNYGQSITINFRKKGNDKEKPQTHESSEVTEVSEVENKTNLLVNETSDEESKEPENETNETETEIEADTIILVNKNNTKQNGCRVLEFISAIILTIAFVSFFIYVTQPKKTDKKNRNSFNELSYYLKVKGN